MERDIGTQGGNYAEHVAGHNIHADIVIINEAPSPPNLSPPTSPEEPCEKRKQIAFIINGSLKNSDPTKLAKLQLLVRAIQQLTEDASFDMLDIKEGSIRLVLEGSETGVARLQYLFDSGELTEIMGFSVITVEPAEVEGINRENPSANPLKEMLITAINTQGAQGCDLSGADLSDAKLSGADLHSNAKLSRADLHGNAKLIGVIISGADLHSNAKLSRANLSRANLSRAKLIGADLSFANLSAADLSGANLSRAKLIGANLSGADLRHANLSGADLRRAKLSGADLSAADLSAADLSGAKLSGANLSGADLSGANLRTAMISTETQLDAKWHLVHDIVNQRLAERDLSGADLSDANLSGANLSGANLSGANLSGADLSFAKLSGADLSAADLSRANLSRANLSRANLIGADLSGVDVKGTIFTGSNGLSESEKANLRSRGAIFQDSPGDRVFSPARR